MAYTSYLLEQYNTTHENIFFRKIDEELRQRFKATAGEHILIGNIRVQGNSLDAIFIKAGAIIIIDFKDYEGEVTFSENGPWKLKTKENNTVFVAGGAVARNPFQQVNAYRFGLMDFIEANKASIIDTNHQNIKWSHIGTMVLFQRAIRYNSNEIPAKLQRYFHITDYKNYIDRIEDIHSDSLNLTTDEIQRLLVVLNVTEESRYDATLEIEEKENNSSVLKYDPELTTRIDKLLAHTPKTSLKNKVLSFYNTMISIERLKDVSVSNLVKYTIDQELVLEGDYELNLRNFANFYEIFKKQRTESFPKALFFSINVKLFDQSIPLFYQTIQAKDIPDDTAIKINLDAIELFIPELIKLNLPEDLIEEISIKINDTKGLNNKITELTNILDVVITIDHTISLALSTESMYTAQLQAEMNSILREKVPFPESNSVFSAVINRTKIKRPKASGFKRFVQITNLNDSQLKAVETAFKNPISVITGPPGTGKSQVVLNILANAIANNQKVLFASRNNKAVDNVYQRFNETLDTDYFLRFGDSRTNYELAELLKKFKTSNTSVNFEENLEKSTALIDELNKEYNTYLDKLANILLLENAVNNYEENKKLTELQLVNWKKSIDPSFYNWFIEKGLEVKVSNSDINFVLNELKATTSFIGKIIFNWFKKSKVINHVQQINTKLGKELSEYLDANFPIIKQNTTVIDSIRENLAAIENLKKKQTDLVLNYNKLNDAFVTSSQKYTAILAQYQAELANENEYIKQVDYYKQVIAKESPQHLKNQIAYNINYSSNTEINQYSSYLTNGFPWKKEELEHAFDVVDEFTTSFNAVSVSNLTVKKAFPLASEFFDLLVIDEASQCDIVSVLPLIYRAKRVCILGDPLQLKHITSIHEAEQQYALDQLDLSINQYDYIKKSLYDTIAEIAEINDIQPILLNEHYRCHPDIIGFSKKHFYKKRLGQDLVIKTNPTSFKYGDVGFNWINVKGNVAEHLNVNVAEVEYCAKLVEYLHVKYPSASIGVITPFKHQKLALQKRIQLIPNLKNTVVDTVNRFQGDEKDIIIFSLVVSDGAKPSLANFINFGSFFLLNVGITRAKSSLYVVGDKTYCRKLINNYGKTLLAHLADYDREIKGEIIIDEVKPKEKIKTIPTEVLPDVDINDEVLNEVIIPENNDLINPATTYETIRALINKAIETESTIEIYYKNYDGEHSIRKLSKIDYNKDYSIDNHIKGYCHNRKEDRTFRIDNISKASICN